MLEEDIQYFPNTSPQESTVIEVPRFKDVPTDVTPTLLERLNGVTDVLSRVSKLVSEDLEKAVSTAVGPDKDGNVPSGITWTLLEVIENAEAISDSIGTT